MSDKLVAGVSGSATARRETHVSSLEELLPSPEEQITASASTGTVPHSTIDGSSSSSPFSKEIVAGGSESASPFGCDRIVAGTTESASALTLEEADVSSSVLLDTPPSEESTTSSPRTLPHSTTDGSSNFSPFRLEKFMAHAAESASAQTLQEPDNVSSSEELLDTTSSEESSTASPGTVLHDTTGGPQPSASSVGPPILFKYPSNWYESFYMRMDRKGHFHMYPDLGGPFESIQEAEAAIDRYLNERQLPEICQMPSEGPLVEWRIKQCLNYPDGTPKRGPESPARKNPYDRQRELVKALLDQYNDYHNLSKDVAHEFRDLVNYKWIYEDNKTYYHFNFTTKTEADDGNLFFAEVLRVKKKSAWVVCCCCEIEPNDDGLCYGCCNIDNNKIMHPNNTRAYIGGHVGSYFPFGGDDFSDDDEDEEAYVARLRVMFAD